VPTAGATVDPDRVSAHARERLTVNKVPRRVVIMNDLPRSQIGKILRRAYATGSRRWRPLTATDCLDQRCSILGWNNLMVASGELDLDPARSRRVVKLDAGDRGSGATSKSNEACPPSGRG